MSDNLNKIVKDMRGQMKLTRNKFGMLTAFLGVDPNEMTVGTFVRLLDNVQWNQTLLREFIEEEYKL